MNKKELKNILVKHKKWLNSKTGGERADLRYADLEGANLRGANLRGANLRGANLRGADLRGADLRYADLEGANLRGANLRGANLQYANLRGANLQDADLQDADLRGADLQHANLDFSCFPLWCGSFDIIDDGHIAKQLLSHVARLNIRDKKLAKWVKSIPKEYKNEFCIRHNIEEIK